MTGVEAILLLIGSIFMVGSFFITEKLSSSELNKIAELSDGELKKIIDRAMEGVGRRIDAAIEEHIEITADQVDRALEKETNEKIMAISEYSDTVVESMNKTHNEIMFLYSMLNDKHTELTGMVSNLQRIAADVRSLEDNLQEMSQRGPAAASAPAKAPETGGISPGPAGAGSKIARTAPKEAFAPQRPKVQEEKREMPKTPVQPSEPEEKGSVNEQILAMHREGLSEVEIARKLGMGIGEIRLIIGLYRGEENS